MTFGLVLDCYTDPRSFLFGLGLHWLAKAAHIGMYGESSYTPQPIGNWVTAALGAFSQLIRGKAEQNPAANILVTECSFHEILWPI